MTLLRLDQTATEWLYSMSRHNPAVEKVAASLAAIFVYSVPVLLLGLFFSRKDRLTSVKILLATAFTWKVLSNLIGTLIYNQTGFRDRPFAAQGLTEFLFEQPQKAFPSDHAAVLCLVTLALFYYKKPTLGWIFLVGTVVSSLARVVIGFHWVGDILGGWLIGLLGFGLLVWLSPYLDKLLVRIKYFNPSENDQLAKQQVS